jgi:serine/threonine protein kinase
MWKIADFELPSALGSLLDRFNMDETCFQESHLVDIIASLTGSSLLGAAQKKCDDAQIMIESKLTGEDPLDRNEAKEGKASRLHGPSCSFSRPWAAGDKACVTPECVKSAAEQITMLAQWKSQNYKLERQLQAAERNYGSVFLARSLENGSSFAVKVMPVRWTTSSLEEFDVTHPTSEERPWVDIGIVAHLSLRGFPYVCDMRGVFLEDRCLYCVSELGTEGDFFHWTQSLPEPGRTREALIRPVSVQILSAVRSLHDLGIAHRDLSLENIIITKQGDGEIKVKIIDFGMAVLERRGTTTDISKPSYQAPEMHRNTSYDTFLSDIFAVGVALFAATTSQYPWKSTKPKDCVHFDFASAHGLCKYMQRRKIMGTPLSNLLTPPLIELLKGLLCLDPCDRFTLGEDCWTNPYNVPVMSAVATEHRSVWGCQWLADHLTEQVALQHDRLSL